VAKTPKDVKRARQLAAVGRLYSTAPLLKGRQAGDQDVCYTLTFLATGGSYTWLESEKPGLSTDLHNFLADVYVVAEYGIERQNAARYAAESSPRLLAALRSMAKHEEHLTSPRKFNRLVMDESEFGDFSDRTFRRALPIFQAWRVMRKYRAEFIELERKGEFNEVEKFGSLVLSDAEFPPKLSAGDYGIALSIFLSNK